MTFEEKVRSLSAVELLEIFIDALKNPVINIDMATFGSNYDGVCFGCAATNTVCKISGVTFTPENITKEFRSKALNTSCYFLDEFEVAVDYLRIGKIEEYNLYTKSIGITILPKPTFSLPTLNNKNYKERIRYYEAYLKEIKDGLEQTA